MILCNRLITVVIPAGLIALALGGCAVAPPTGPSIVALPHSGEPLAQFQADDEACREYASQSTNPSGAAQAASTNSLNSAAVGALGGAAIGALLGAATGNAGAGAAIGAGGGLLIGSANGANGAQYSAAGIQSRYDAAYAQCIISKGDTIEPSQLNYAPQPVYVVPQPYYAAPPDMYSPPAY